MEMNSVEEKARELLENRVASVTALEAAVRELDKVRATVAAAEKAASDAFAAAAEAGWSPAELRTLGFTVPSARRSSSGRSAPRKRASTSQLSQD